MYKYQHPLTLSIAFGLGLTGQSVSASNPKPSDKKLNIVFLLADDIRWNSLHCMGNDIVITPNIDALATDGIRYENAYTSTPISCCSRATLLTGQYMSRNKVVDFAKTISEENFKDTYPGVLQNAGYFTGFVGKYGVGKIRNSDFDFTKIYEGLHWYPVDEAKIKSVGEGEHGRIYTKIIGDSIHVTDKNAKDAIEFLNKRPKDKNFCLSVSFFAPHAQDNHVDQYRYKPSSEKYYQNVEIPLPATSTIEYLKALPPFISDEKCESRARWHWRFDTPEKYQKYMKAYYRLITDMDEAVGKIIAELKKQGVYENTLIVFMGDNGYFHSDHQLADKWYAYEQSIRVPLIIHDPRIASKMHGTVNKNMVLNVDIAPTLVAASGVQIPSVMQGYDLTKTYKSNKYNTLRSEFFCEHPVINNETFIPSSQALITLTDKYIIYPFYNYEEYFNLKDDPNEVKNGISNPTYTKRIEELKVELNKLKTIAR